MGITQHTFGEDGVRQIVNLALAPRASSAARAAGLMPIRGHSGVQGGAEMGAYATAFPGGLAITPTTRAPCPNSGASRSPHSPGMTTPEMIDAAAEGDLDVLWSVGGNFLEVLPEPARVEAALAQDPAARAPGPRVDPPDAGRPGRPGDTVLVLPAMTRYEIPGGVTSTSTERRIIFSPEIRGPRVGTYADGARPEGEVLLDLARRVRPEPRRSARTSSTRMPSARRSRAVVPLYEGIEALAKKGDQLQYGGPHLCAGWRFPTATGKAHFGVVPLPEERASPRAFVAT